MREALPGNKTVLPDWKCPNIEPEAQNDFIWKKIIVHVSNVAYRIQLFI